MSCQRGNDLRTRPQKHKNTRVFKNTLHDKSKKTKIINSTQVTNSCDRCKAIIEWKIKYKKYKQLKSAKTCIKCSNKSVKQSYHTICEACVRQLKVCAKCGTSDLKNSVPLNPDQKVEDLKLDDDSDSSDAHFSDDEESES